MKKANKIGFCGLRSTNSQLKSQLAHLLDVSLGYIGHVESSKDRAKYDLNMLVKFVRVLECTYDDLLPSVSLGIKAS